MRDEYSDWVPEEDDDDDDDDGSPGKPPKPSKPPPSYIGSGSTCSYEWKE